MRKKKKSTDSYLTVSCRVKPRSISEYDALRHMCRASKDIYNMGLYTCRQHFFETNKYLNYFDTYKVVKSKYPDYKNLHSQAAQQTLLKIHDDMQSFFENLKKAKNENRKVKLPKYKDKEGYFSAYLSKDCFKIQNSEVRISISKACKSKTGLKFLYIPLPKLIFKKIIKQIEIIPLNNAKHFAINFTYIDDKKYEKIPESKEIRSLAIDLGLNNLATITNTVNHEAVIISGREIKSINHYYNKNLAKLKSIAKKENNLLSTKKINRLTKQRANRIKDRFHKISEGIIKYCLKHKINNITIGNNKQWKTKINIGKKNNQQFVQIPHAKLISYIKYRANRHGITVSLQEESYTSKCDALAKEEIQKQSNYLGRRIKRGLFKSSIGKLINADVNGSINILRKSKGEVLDNIVDSLASIGLVYSPRKLFCTGSRSLSL